ncbi:TadE/TadG family type IV pilus assembly protein [Butyrivibrio sp. AE2032]|uniref:TadE/TadG family type IV pilus assembly protein n=1 Tax=Butyrivibrio sp. AE2032 TaxID=1458463 RepID=UPI00054F203B|nr:hypothetical protein [Butyrivibrio sp. AE2032]
MRSFSKDEDGTIMLESVFCILATFIVLMMVMVMGFLVYQHAMMGIVANQVAEEIAVTYKFPDLKDPSNITKKRVTEIVYYKSGSEKAEEYRAANEKTLRKIARTRLTNSSLAEDSGGYTVSLERIHDDVGRYHYKITVKNKYSFFYEDVLNILGLDRTERLQATSYVAGTDALEITDITDTSIFVTGKVLNNNIVDTMYSFIHELWEFLVDRGVL